MNIWQVAGRFLPENFRPAFQDDEVEPDLSLVFQELPSTSGEQKKGKKKKKKTQEDEAVKTSSPGQLLGLVLTPTRELAIQVRRHIEAVARNLDIKVRVSVFE